MSLVLVDSNVVLDIADKGSSWHEWSLETLEDLEYENNLAINSIIYSEVSIGYATIEELSIFITNCGFEFIELPPEALFLAGKVGRADDRLVVGKISDRPVATAYPVADGRVWMDHQLRRNLKFPDFEAAGSNFMEMNGGRHISETDRKKGW